MDQQQWEKVNEIVDTALDFEEEKRETYIQEQCQDNQHLKRQVTELLKSIKQSDTENFLENTGDYPQHLAREISEENIREESSALIGTTIGRYKLSDLIGHGGMGSVFLAERADEAYNQKVALKLMRRGMDTPTNIARFRRERQILANLDHPNIARLLDGGITEDGLPYIVMEYVEGKPILEYCDLRCLDINQRLTLFSSVCEAIQHAHNNAVIHRDLKPSNIMVSPDGEVKVLDFGIAKLLEPEDPELTLYRTRSGTRLLTISYAAPEQIENKTITTATDTYALGTLLYKLVTGVHPFDWEDKDLAEMEQLVRKKTPARPSDRFQKLASNHKEQITSLRNMATPSLFKKLKGDLDAIIMKALRKEPGARYRSTEQLIADLNRRKENLPVIARKDTFRYKSGRFIKRNKTALSVTAGFIMLLAGFLIFHTLQITKERNRAQLEAEKARKTLQYLVGVFQHADPNQPGQREITAGQILEDGTDYIEEEVNNTDIKASLSNALGTIYQHLGNYDKAEPLLYEALKHNQNQAAGNNLDLAASMRDWAGYNMKIGSYDTARKYFEKSANVFQELGDKKEYASIIGELGWIDYREGDFERADSLINEALKINLSLHGLKSKEAAMDLQYLGWIKNAQGDYRSSERLFQNSLSIRKSVLGNEHRLVAQTLQSLGRVLYNKGDYQKAKEIENQALNIQREIFSGTHPDIATSMNILGLINMRQENFDKAETYFREALQMRLKFYGENHPDVLKSRNDLATIYFFNEDYENAAELFKKVAASNKELRGPDHPELATGLNNLAKSLHKAGRKQEALEYYSRSIQIGNENYSTDHPIQIQFRKNAALLHEELNRYQEASKLWLKNFRAIRQKKGLKNSEAKNALTHLIQCQQQLGNAEKVTRYQALLTGTAK